MDVFVLFCSASFRDENFASVRIFSASSLGWPRSSKRARNSSFRNSNVSLTEFFLSKRKVSPLIKPFLTLRE